MIAVLAQNQAGELTQHLFVLRQQNDPSLRLWTPFHHSCGDLRFPRREFQRWKINPEGRTPSDLAAAADLPSMLPNDRIHRRQPKPGVLPRLSRAEKGLENVFLEFRGQTQPGVRNRQQDVITRPELNILHE